MVATQGIYISRLAGPWYPANNFLISWNLGRYLLSLPEAFIIPSSSQLEPATMGSNTGQTSESIPSPLLPHSSVQSGYA